MAETATPPFPASPSPRVPASSPDDARELDLRALGDRARELRKQIVDAQAIVTGLRGELRKTERQIVDVAMDPNARLFPTAAPVEDAGTRGNGDAETWHHEMMTRKAAAIPSMLNDAADRADHERAAARAIGIPTDPASFPANGERAAAPPERLTCCECGESFSSDAEGCGGLIPGGPTCPKCTPHDLLDHPEHPEHDDSPRTVSLPVIDAPVSDGPGRFPPGPIIPGETYTPNELGVDIGWVHTSVVENEIFPSDHNVSGLTGSGGRIHSTVAIGDDDYVLTGGSVRNGFVRCRLQLAYPLDNWPNPVRTWRKALDEADGDPEGAELKGVRVEDGDGKEWVIDANIDTIYLDVLLEDLPKHAIYGTAPEATPLAAAAAEPAKGVLVEAGKWYTFEELGVTPDELWQSQIHARIFPPAPDFKGDGGFIGVPVFVDNEPYAVVGLAMKTNQGEYTLQRISDAQELRPTKNWRDIGAGTKVAPEDAELDGMGMSEPHGECWTFHANATRIHVQCPRSSIPDGREATEAYARAQAKYKPKPQSKGPPLEREEEKRVNQGGTEGTEKRKLPANLSNEKRALWEALHCCSGAVERWEKLRSSGADDVTLKAQIGSALGNSGGSSGSGFAPAHTRRGGANPAVWVLPPGRYLERRGEKPTFSGRMLIDTVREILQIPYFPPIRNPQSEISNSPKGPANLPIPEKPRGQSQTWYQWRSSVLGALSTAGVKDVDDIYPTGQALEWYLAGVKPKDAAAKYRASLPKAGKGAADPDGDWQRIKKGIADVLHAPEPKEKRGVKGARPLSFGQWFSTFAATHKATPFSHELPWPRRDDPRVHELWGQYPALRPADAARRFVKERSANADRAKSKKGAVK